MESSGSFTVDAEYSSGTTSSAGAATGYFGTATSTTSSLSAVSGVNIGTLAGARGAIDSLDGALRMVASQ